MFPDFMDTFAVKPELLQTWQDPESSAKHEGWPSRWRCLFLTLSDRCGNNISHDAHFCKLDLAYLLHFHYKMGLPLPWESIPADGLEHCGVEGIHVVAQPVAGFQSCGTFFWSLGPSVCVCLPSAIPWAAGISCILGDRNSQMRR